jgi:hypothetical protein
MKSTFAKKPSVKVMDLYSGFDLVDALENESKISIKGFASVEIVDRQNEIVDPFAFNVDTFLNDGTVYVNHRPWTDSRGNQVRVGRVTRMVPAYISGEEGDNWVVSDLATKSFVSDFPKSKVPEMSIGDRGLFAFVDITQPEVIEMVKRGEFSHFSWRGLSKKSMEFNGAERVYRIVSADLWELSIVNVPVVNQASFVTSKALDDLYVSQVLLPKSEFKTFESVKSFLQAHDLESSDLRDSGDFICAIQEDPEIYDAIKSVRVKLGGADVIMSPKKETPVDKKSVLKQGSSKGVKMQIFTFSAETLSRLFGDNYSTSTKSVTIGDTEVEVTEIKAKPQEETESVDFQKLIEEKFNELSSKFNVEDFNAKFTEIQARHDELFKQLSDLTAKTEVTAEATAEATQAAASAEATSQEAAIAEVEAVKSLAVQLFNQQEEMRQSLTNIANVLSKVTPNGTNRSESSKSVAPESNADPLQAYFTRVVTSR